jgi:hypothetical protein
VCAATLLFQWPFFDRFFSAMDEGHMLYYAELVANGGHLYRDATIYPLPGAFYLLALIFEVFEPSIRLSRLVVVVEFGVFVALVFAWLRRLVAPGFAALGVALLWAYRIWAFPHWQMYSYSSTALLLQGASALLLVRYLGNERRGTLALSGLVFGLGVFCKQDYGAAFLLASALTLFVHTRSRREATSWPLLLLTFLVPAAAVGAAAGFHFLLQGQLLRVVQLTVLNHFSGLSSYGYQAFPSLWPLFVQDPALRDHVGIHNFFPAIVEVVHGLDVRRSWWFRETPLYDSAIKLLVFGPRLLVALGALRLWRRRDALRDPDTRPRAMAEVTLTAVAAAVALLSALYRPQDYLHLAILYWPFLCLLVVYANAFWKSSSRVARRRAALLAGPALTAVFAYSGWLGLSLRSVYPEPIPLPRAGVRVKPQEAGLLADVVDRRGDALLPNRPLPCATTRTACSELHPLAVSRIPRPRSAHRRRHGGGPDAARDLQLHPVSPLPAGGGVRAGRLRASGAPFHAGPRVRPRGVRLRPGRAGSGAGADRGASPRRRGDIPTARGARGGTRAPRARRAAQLDPAA